jgi:hypothetical protein
MVRAYAYLAAAGVIWLVEAVLFGHFLKFAFWQTALLVVIYAFLFLIAARVLLRGLREGLGESEHDVAAWRVVSLAPMLVVIAGSFASLPLLLLVAAAGRLLKGH